MKKKTLSLIISLALIVSLSACGNDKFTEEEVTVKPVEEIEKSEQTEEAIEQKEEVIDFDKEVVFSDEYLAKVAKENANSITVGGLQEITDLELNYDKITVPEELAYFANLQSLEIDAQSNGDISWLSYFPNLEYLDINYNHIDNIDELGKCVNLVALNIESYNITDISFLEKLTLLEALSIETDALEDFSPISNLTNLSALYLYVKGTAESLNIDFSMLTNLKVVKILGTLTDYTSLNSLNIYDEPTYIDDTGYWSEFYEKIHLSFTNPLTETYRDNYSIDKRPEKEYFKTIDIQTGATDDTIRVAAQINYKYLQSLNFHIDRYYRLVEIPSMDGTQREVYQEAWDNLVEANGDPLNKNEAVTVTSLPDLEDFNNPKVYLDGKYIGLYCPLEDMMTGYVIGGTDAVEYVNSVYVNAEGYARFGVDSGSKSMFSITVRNTGDIAKPIAECEISEIRISRNTDTELRLPQGSETNEYVSWDYPHRSFTDIYENCYTDGRNGDFDIRSYYIFCNDNGDVIEIQVQKKAIQTIVLEKREIDRIEEMKRTLGK